MKLIKNLFYIFLPLIIGIVVGLITQPSIEYNTLVKPPLSPPGILFPIVWSIIYLLMGISYFLIKNEKNTTLESIVYYLQLFVNALWSIIFFNLEWYFFSIIWIILLDLLVATMIYLFYKKNKISGYLNLLYAVWLIFATYLTIGIYILN